MYREHLCFRRSTRLSAGISKEGKSSRSTAVSFHITLVRVMRLPNFARISRYGRDSIPTMEQRDKERERERLERKAQEESAERDKENRHFVSARRTTRASLHSESPEQRHAQEATLTAAVGGGGDIYERTTEYVRRRESR